MEDDGGEGEWERVEEVKSCKSGFVPILSTHVYQVNTLHKTAIGSARKVQMERMRCVNRRLRAVENASINLLLLFRNQHFKML